jgi:hypothetical protein
MATTCAEIVCTDACADQLPIAAFSICAPVTNFGQISKVYITNDGYPLTDENDLTEWQTRANLDVSDPSRIIELSVIGDKPLPTASEVALSRGRTTVGAREHVINIKIDETNDTNYEMMRKFECGKTVRVWFETFGGLLYGGRTGVLASVTLAEIIPEGTDALIMFQGTIKWKSKFSPCRTTSPMAGIDLVEEAGS